MNGKNINKTGFPLKVLVAPLDWGLGHTTRCIPIIKHLISNGATVLLAGEGPCKDLLKVEFPHLQILPLTGYRVKYHAGRSGFCGRMILQVPRLLATIRKENTWLEETVKKENIDVVISDNRYGLHNSKAYTIIITHQLRVHSGINAVDDMLQGMHYRYLNQFDECWVPDMEEKPGLAHGLSHPAKLPTVPVKYMGLLSRFEKLENVESRYDWLVLISGPEPQRSEWERIILKDHDLFKGEVAMVRGLPSGGEKISAPRGWEIIDHLPANKLNELLHASNNILCRSGYSTLMDLRAIGKKALIVATPGQKEQEYLAEKNNGQHGFVSVKQYGDDLQLFMDKIEKMPTPASESDSVASFIRQWMIQFSDRVQEK